MSPHAHNKQRTLAPNEQYRLVVVDPFQGKTIPFICGNRKLHPPKSNISSYNMYILSNLVLVMNIAENTVNLTLNNNQSIY